MEHGVLCWGNQKQTFISPKDTTIVHHLSDRCFIKFLWNSKLCANSKIFLWKILCKIWFQKCESMGKEMLNNAGICQKITPSQFHGNKKTMVLCQPSTLQIWKKFKDTEKPSVREVIEVLKTQPQITSSSSFLQKNTFLKTGFLITTKYSYNLWF